MITYSEFNNAVGHLAEQIIDNNGTSRKDFFAFELQKAELALEIKKSMCATLAVAGLFSAATVIVAPTPMGILMTVGCLGGSRFVYDAMNRTFLGAMAIKNTSHFW